MKSMALAALALILAFVGPISGADGGQATPSEPKSLKDLVAKAKDSSHVVMIAVEGESPEAIRVREQAFEKRFGFPVRIQSQPGHHRDMPIKVVEAAKTGRSVIDMWEGGLPLMLGMFRAGNLRRPPWEAIYEGWPLSRKLRAAIPNITGAPDGSALSDSCMQNGMGSWSLVYNIRRVKPEGMKLEDLTAEKWRNRVVWDARASGLFALPFAPGWDVERMRVFAHNLGANGAKLVAGGTTNILQALVQGEGDISVASMTTVVEQKTLGAPLDIAFADFVMENFTVTCLIKPGVNDPNMTALFWGWNTFDGNYVDAKFGGGGVFRLYEEEEKYLPLVKLARENGIKSGDQVVGPKSEEDAIKSAEYREIAIKALKAGVASKKKITR